MGAGRSQGKAAESRAAAQVIVRALRDAGHAAYFAGGCVRDELLGLTPTDYDVATDARPDRIRAIFPRTAEVGASFGVMLVHEGHAVVEVATFRADGSYSDKRRPDSVTFSDPRRDAARRDFTVNALFFDPVEDRVIDYVGGQADLQRRVLRAVGDPDQRLSEDHLRALRAVRLAARLKFDIEPRTADAIRRHASELSGVSRERIGEEVRRMIEHPTRANAARWLADLALERPVFSTAALGLGTVGVFAPALANLPAHTTVSTALAAWALDLGAQVQTAGGDINETGLDRIVGEWRRCLCLSNDERSWLLATLRGLATLEGPWGGMGEAAQKRTASTGWFEQALVLVRQRNPAAAEAIRQRVAQLASTYSGLHPEPLVTGDVLVAMGLKPGPVFKSILDRVYDAQLEGKVRTLEEAKELAASLGV